MILRLIIFFTGIVAFGAFSQQLPEEELIRTHKRLVDKVKLYQQINLDSGQVYLDSVFEVTKELNQDYYLAQAFQLKSKQFMQASNPDSALYYCNKSIRILNEYPDSMAYFAAQYNLGTIYLSSRDHIRALAQFKNVLKAIDQNFEQLVLMDYDRVNLNRAYAYVSIGLVYSQLNDHENELKNLRKGLKISYKVDTEESRRLQAITLGNLGLAYFDLEDYEKAEYYAIAGMEKKKTLGMTGTLGYNYQILAKAAFGRDKIRLCLKYLELSDEYFFDFNNYIELNRNNFLRAKCEKAKGNTTKALDILKKLEVVYQASFSDGELAELYDFMSRVYKDAGNSDKAYDKLLTSKKINDEVNLRNDRQMVGEFLDFFEREEARLNGRLEALRHKQAKEKLELQIEGDQEKKVWIYTLFVVSILGLLLIIYVISRAYKRNKRINEDLNESIHENRVLFKEVHHRVKNNFQVISSLLNLQQGIEEDARGKKVLTDAQGRIQSMALVHEMLYQKNEVKRINFKEYANELLSSILKSSADNEMLEYTIEGESDSFDLEVAVPIGLILNEAVTNSVKYAFNGLQIGKIGVELSKVEKGNYKLVIRDNGIGIPEEYISGSKETLGIELINILSEQLNGSAEFDNTKGTVVTVFFKT